MIISLDKIFKAVSVALVIWSGFWGGVTASYASSSDDEQETRGSKRSAKDTGLEKDIPSVSRSRIETTSVSEQFNKRAKTKVGFDWASYNRQKEEESRYSHAIKWAKKEARAEALEEGREEGIREGVEKGKLIASLERLDDSEEEWTEEQFVQKAHMSSEAARLLVSSIPMEE